MYKVMIVDDEPIIRCGIRACLDWNVLGLEVVGEYANGEEAYAAMADERPDILITDIKMPLMDGIELTGKAMALIPTLKVVFVSSYNDFEFVREGIRLGALDYILKPTLEPSELEALMRRCVAMLDREREVNRHLSLADRQAREEERRRWEQELKRLLRGGAASAAAEPPDRDRKERLPDWLARPVLSACILLDHTQCFDENNGFMHKAILLEDVRQAWYELCPVSVALVTEPGGLFLVIPQEGAGPEALGRFATCKRRVEERCGVSLTAGVFLHRDGAAWEERFKKAREAGARRFFAGTGGVHVYDGARPAPDTAESAGFTSRPLPPSRPATPAEMRRELAERHRVPVGMAGLDSWATLPYISALGGSFMSDDFSGADGFLNSDATVSAVTRLLEWHRKGILSPDLFSPDFDRWGGIQSGQFLMIDEGPWFYSILLNDRTRTVAVDDITVSAPFPSGAGPASILGGENLVMLKGVRHPEEAWTFMRWMTDVPYQTVMAGTGLLPTNRRAAENIRAGAGGYVQSYVASMDRVFLRPPVRDWERIEEIFKDALQSIFLGDADVRETLDAAAREIDRVMNRTGCR